jgi:lysophospholipase L1-like esterase
MQVVVIGDSTAAPYGPERYPQVGWAMILPCAFDGAVTVHNDARGGRSTKSFRAEGLWDISRERLKPGDVLLIQFGHNDQSVEKGERYIDPPGFAANLRLFVSAARERGATPVLITPVARRRFSEGAPIDAHGEYDDVVRAVATETATPLIDLNVLSMAELGRLGEEPSKNLFLHLAPGAFPSHPEGLTDNTHFSERGARTVAGLVAGALAGLDTPLTGRIDPKAGALDPDFHAGGPACTTPDTP